MGTSGPGTALASRTATAVTLAPKQKRRIASIAERQGISTSEVILRSLDSYEQQEPHQQEIIQQMQTVLNHSLESLREARHFADETNRLILLYRDHPELVLEEDRDR